MAILGLDYGGSRTGVAISPDGAWVFERPAIHSHTRQELFAALRTIIEDDRVEVVVVGLPLSLKGSDTAQTVTVREFLEELREIYPEINIIEQDERFTSKQAGRLGGHRATSHHDSLAAKLLVEQYIEQRSSLSPSV